MNYYQHHIGDFNSATMCLTRVERSLYRDLIEIYYDKEKPLTSDLRILKKLAMVHSDEEEAALKMVLELFFELSDDGFYCNKRCDEELDRYKANNSAKARAGKASAEARRKKIEAEKERDSTPVERVLNSVCTEDQQNPTNQKPITNNQKPITTSSSPAVTPCRYDEIVSAYHEILPELSQVKVLTEKRKAQLRQRWREDVKRQDAEWWKKYFAYVKQSDFLCGRVEGREGKRPFVADLEWLTNPTNFAKVVEGKYHEGAAA